MANPLKGEALLRLADGRELTLVLDFEALVAAETGYGKPLPQLLGDAAAGFMGAQRALLAGALSRHHPQISPREAGEMLLSEVDAVADALGRVMQSSHPAGTTEVKKPGNAPRRPAGKNSGRSGAKRG